MRTALHLCFLGCEALALFVLIGVLTSAGGQPEGVVVVAGLSSAFGLVTMGLICAGISSGLEKLDRLIERDKARPMFEPPPVLDLADEEPVSPRFISRRK